MPEGSLHEFLTIADRVRIRSAFDEDSPDGASFSIQPDVPPRPPHMTRNATFPALLAMVLLITPSFGQGQENGNLLEDPSFEMTKDKDQFGLVFAKWGGWNYEGDCEFRVGQVAHTGKHSCLLFGGSAPKIRVAQNVALEPGRYRVTAYLRGLDIGTGTYGMSTEFMFDGNYIPLDKKGTFGWTRLTYVGEVKEKKPAGPSFGLMAPGYFWIDDVSLEKVGHDVAADREAGARRGGSADRAAGRDPRRGRPLPGVRLPQRRMEDLLRLRHAARGRGGRPSRPVPPVKPIASFEDANPFSGGVVVAARAPEGRKALRIDRSYVSMDQPQDWLGYDFLKAELDSEATVPMDLYVEIRDTGTRDYWTRVNYVTVVPPGRSTLIIPVKHSTWARRRGRAGCSAWARSPGWSSASATSRPARSCWTTSAWSATTRRRG